MIESIAFRDPEKVELPKEVRAGYMYSLPSLKGRTFRFTPGINIVVGKNGCGKTSLLNVMRYLTFCDGEFGTRITGKSYWKLHYRQVFEEGHWHLSNMFADYSRSVISLRKHDDIGAGQWDSGVSSFIQSMNSSSKSKGELVKSALGMMMAYLYDGEEGFSKGGQRHDKVDREFNHLKFRKMALEHIEAAEKSDNDYYARMWTRMLQYYKDNALEATEENKKFRGVTFLLDEPDAGMDIDNIGEVYKFITSMPKGFQTIVALHNIGMISKLAKRGDVNFIELTEGYVDKVREFFL